MHRKALTSIRTAIISVLSLFVVLLSAVFAPAEILPLKSYTSADGIGSSFVSYGMRDSRGFLWFCTRDGLSRFDGSRFITYQVGDQSSQPTVENIFESRRGIYWITTTGGLYRYDPATSHASPPANNDRPILNANFVSNARGILFEDSRNSLWFGGDDLYRVADSDGAVSLERSSLNLPPDPSVTLSIASIIEASDESLWMVTTWGLVRRLPDGRTILYRNNSPRTDAFTSVLEDRDRRIWVGRSTGVYEVSDAELSDTSFQDPLTIRDLDKISVKSRTDSGNLRTSNQTVKFEGLGSSADAKFVYKTSDEHIWITTGGALVEYDGESFITHSGGTRSLKGVGSMIEDAGNDLWLCLSTGLWRFERHGLVTYDISDGLNTPSIFVINETGDGSVYASTTNFFISKFNGTGFGTSRPRLPADAKALWTSNSVFQDSKRQWWFLTSDRLYRFASMDLAGLASANPLATYDRKTGLKADQMFHIFEDSHGGIWVSNRDAKPENSGLARWDPKTQAFRTFSEADGFPTKTSISSFAEDRSGTIWLGAYEGGLLRYLDAHFEKVDEAELSGGIITSILVDKDDRVWCGSSLNGIFRFDNISADPLNFVRYTTLDGLASNNVRSLVADTFGNVYAGTARGIDRISSEPAKIKHYSVKDGLAGDFVNTSFLDSRGDLWFGTPNGLSRLSPEPDKRSGPPPVYIGGLRVAGERRAIPELGTSEISDLDLSYTQNNLQIEFFGIDFSSGKSLRYQYQLEGADREWSQATEQSSVTYANIASGGYRFLVRAVSSDGTVSPQPASISFRITPPFWRRWWFVTGAILLVGFAVFGLDRYRIKKTKQVESALSRSVESETRFRTLAETASDAIVTIDTDSRIVFVNEAVEQVFGYGSEELIGQKLTMLMPETFRSRHDAGLDRYLSTDRKNMSWTGVELTGRHRSGIDIPLEVSFGEFILNGKRYFTGVARDISERKNAEEALRRSRDERFNELERVRTRIATDLHDDIGASLTQIAVLSEVVRSNTPSDAASSDSHLKKISSLSSELMQAMGDVVWAINPRNDTMPNLLKRMRRFASDIFSAGNIHFRFDSPEVDDNTAVGANIRREVFSIFKECVNNIARHSQCSEAEIVLLLEDRSLLLEFRDNGRGFDTAEVLSEAFSPETGGNGLINIRRRVGDLHGICTVSSTIGSGTIIKIEIPLSPDGEVPTSQTERESRRNSS